MLVEEFWPNKDFEKKSPAQIYNPVQLSTFTSGNFARIAEADFHVQSYAVPYFVDEFFWKVTKVFVFHFHLLETE